MQTFQCNFVEHIGCVGWISKLRLTTDFDKPQTPGLCFNETEGMREQTRSRGCCGDTGRRCRPSEGRHCRQARLISIRARPAVELAGLPAVLLLRTMLDVFSSLGPCPRRRRRQPFHWGYPRGCLSAVAPNKVIGLRMAYGVWIRTRCTTLLLLMHDDS